MTRISTHDLVHNAATPGERLRIARTNAGLTMGQIARLTGDTVAHVSAEEVGEVALSPERIRFLASYYGASIAWVETGALNEVDDLARSYLDALEPDHARDLLALLGTLAVYESRLTPAARP